MSIDKDSNIWNQAKKVIKSINILSDVQDTISPDLNDTILELIEVYDVNRQDYIDIEGVMADNENINSSLDTSKTTLKEYFDNALLSLVESESYPADMVGDIPLILKQMDEDMETAGHYILENAITITPTSGAANIGDGDIQVDAINGEEVENEWIKAETVTLECIQDGQLGGTPGAEIFKINGEQDFPVEKNTLGGSGAGPQVQVASATSFLTNGDFENFTSDAPNDWDIETGAAGTEILENTTDEIFGSACLEFFGTGTAPKISQNVEGSVEKGQKYLLSAMIQTVGVSGGTITVEVGSTSTNKIQIGAAWPNGVWTRYNAIIYMPNNLNGDITVDIYTNAALTVGGQVFFDDVLLSPYVEHDGVFYALTRGNIDFVTGDKWTVTNTNDRAGNINTFVGDWYKFQFRTSTVGANTVVDAPL
jgi:hypothetical protein